MWWEEQAFLTQAITHRDVLYPPLCLLSLCLLTFSLPLSHGASVSCVSLALSFLHPLPYPAVSFLGTAKRLPVGARSHPDACHPSLLLVGEFCHLRGSAKTDKSHPGETLTKKNRSFLGMGGDEVHESPAEGWGRIAHGFLCRG